MSVTIETFEPQIKIGELFGVFTGLREELELWDESLQKKNEYVDAIVGTNTCFGSAALECHSRFSLDQILAPI